MNDHEWELMTYVEEEASGMLNLLEQLVNINSYSYNREGIRAVLSKIESLLLQAGCSVAVDHRDVPHPTLRAQCGSTGGRRVLLLGHADTVFPPSEEATRLRRVGEGLDALLFGPGVADMKGGLVMMCYAMLALLRFATSHEFSVSALITSDEELGSPISRVLSRELAATHDLCLIFEPPPCQDAVIVGRRGIRHFDLVITGKASHSGAAPQQGINAIEELAHKIIKLANVVKAENGATVNFGKIRGGSAINCVSAEASLLFEYRYVTTEQGDRILNGIQEIVRNTTVWNADLQRGPRSELRTLADVPPWELGKRGHDILDDYLSTYVSIGLKPPALCRVGSASDANLVSAVDVPVLDGLGPVGGGDHTADEYIHASSLLNRCKAVTLFLQRYLLAC